MTKTAATDNNGISIKPELLQKLLWPVFAVYCLLVVMGVMNHESWADEAQAWLLARDNTPAAIIKILPDEGHPPFWYVPLYIMSHAGLPYESMKWLAGIAMMLAAYLLMFRTRANIVLKLLIPFSYFFLYEYSLIGRSYSIAVLLSMLIIALYEKRFEKPWLFALCVVALGNTHVITVGFAVAIMCVYVADAVQYKKLSGKVYAAIAIMAVGLLYLLPYMSSSQMAPYYEKQVEQPSNHIKAAIGNALVAGNNSFIALAIFLALLVLLLKYTKPFFIAVCGIAGLFFVVAVAYESKIRHQGLMFIMLLVAYILTDYYKNDKLNLRKISIPAELYGSWLLAATVLLQLSATFKSYRADNEKLFSGSKEVAEYLQDNMSDSTIVVAYQATSTLSVLPYMPKELQFYYAECERYGTYYVYDTCFKKEIWMYPVDYAVKVAHDHFPDKLKDVIFLFNYPIQQQTQKYLDLQYTTSEPTLLWDERFFVYKFKQGVK